MAINDSWIDPVPKIIQEKMYSIVAKIRVSLLPIHCSKKLAIRAAGIAPIGGALAFC